MKRDWANYNVKPLTQSDIEGTYYSIKGTEKNEQKYLLKNQIYGIGKYEESIINEFLNNEVVNYFVTICKRHGYVVAFRKTGMDSIEKLALNAHPKPHRIMDKSMKKTSLGGSLYDAMKDKYPLLVGLVGKQKEIGANSNFIGIYVYSADAELLSKLKFAIYQSDNDVPYIDFGLLLGKDKESVCLKMDNYVSIFDKLFGYIDQNKKEDFVSCCYTGDYDLHEAYDKHNQQIIEASPEKVILLKYLNNIDPNSSAIVIEDILSEELRRRKEGIEKRIKSLEDAIVKLEKGKKFLSSKEKKELNEKCEQIDALNYFLSVSKYAVAKHIKVDLPDGLIQHGDQATAKIYGYMNIESIADKVLQEEKGELLWCYRGVWFKTGEPGDDIDNRPAHAELRKALGLNSHWAKK